jgi:hypothetical protein
VRSIFFSFLCEKSFFPYPGLLNSFFPNSFFLSSFLPYSFFPFLTVFTAFLSVDGCTLSETFDAVMLGKDTFEAEKFDASLDCTKEFDKVN